MAGRCRCGVGMVEGGNHIPAAEERIGMEVHEFAMGLESTQSLVVGLRKYFAGLMVETCRGVE